MGARQRDPLQATTAEISAFCMEFFPNLVVVP